MEKQHTMAAREDRKHDRDQASEDRAERERWRQMFGGNRKLRRERYAKARAAE